MNKRLSLSLLLFVAFAVFYGLPSAFAMSVPLGVANVLNITLGSSVSANVPFQLPFNALKYNVNGNYLASNVMNIVLFNTANALTCKLWDGGNVLNEMQSTNLYNANELDLWGNCPFSVNTMANVIAIGIGLPTTDYYLGQTTNGLGLAPQLSAIYNSLDNGASVFPIWFNFAGTSTPSGMTKTGTININNGASTSVSIAGSLLTTASYGVDPANTFSFYGNVMGNAGGANNGCMGYVSSACSGASQEAFFLTDGAGGPGIQPYFNGVKTQTFTQNTFQIWSVNVLDTADVSFSVNYGTANIYGGGTFTLTQHVGIGNQGSNVNNVLIYWLRQNPVSSPVITYGIVQQIAIVATINLPASITYGNTQAVTGSCAAGDTCQVYNTNTVTQVCTGTTTCTYTTNILAVGSYGFNAIDTTLSTSSGTKVLTVSQATPTITLPSFPVNQIYSGNTVTITANIVSINNQLTANAWVNNVVQASFTTQNVFTENNLGTYVIVANTLGNGNYIATSLTNTFSIYVPFTVQNSIGSVSISPSTSPLTYNTYYPIELSVSSPSNVLTYTLTQGTNTLVSNALSFSFVPNSLQNTGNYVYSLTEFQSASSNTVNLVLSGNTLNMVVLKSGVGCQPQITPGLTPEYWYQPLAINGLTQVCWNSIPSVYYIDTNKNSTTPAANTVITQGWNTNTVPINLEVGYAQFIPELYFNLTTNTGETTNTVSILPYLLTLTNSLTSNRLIANFSIFSQETFNAIPTQLSLGLNGTINGWTINSILTSATSSNTFYLYGSNSQFINSPITYSLNASATTPLYYFQSDTYCTQTSIPGSVASFPLGLVDTNGSRYTIYAYTAGGGSAGGYLMQILEQKGIGSTMVQSYLIPSSIPFSLPLEATGQQYAFNIYNRPCTLSYFKGGFSVPSNPIYLTLNISGNAYIYNVSKAQGQCKIVSVVTGNYNIGCKASDNTNLVYQYKTFIYHTTSLVGTTTQVFNDTTEGPSFVANVTLPGNRTYSWQIYAYAYQQEDPVSGLCFVSCVLGFQPLQLAAPLFGVAAVLLMLTLILGGASTGKSIVMLMLANAGFFMVALLGIDIQLPVAVVFLVISIVAIWWELKH